MIESRDSTGVAYGRVTTKFDRVSRGLRFVTLVSTCLALAACHGRINDYDTAGGASKKDYESLLGRRGQDKPSVKPGEEPPIPGYQSILAAPAAPELADTRRVSVAVTESTPVRDILIELARKAEVDLELDQRISGGIIMTATDRPFIDVIDRICDLAELRYTFRKNTLHVEVDDPYMEQYHLDVLNISRESTSDVSSSTDASSVSQAIGATGGGGGGGSNKSAASITAKSNADFWGSLATNVKNILSGIQARHPTTSPEVQAAFVPAAKAAAPAAPAAGAAPATGPGAGAVNAARGLAGRQDQVNAILAEEQNAPAAGTPTRAAVSTAATGDSSFTINPEAGIVTVFATQRQHKAISRYLREVLTAVNQEVLIEAKVVEVQLNDQYRAGINWTALLGPTDGTGQLPFGGGTKLVTDFQRGVTTSTIADPTIGVVTSNNTRSLTASIQMIKQFGTVRTLSNPRLTVVNNQMAMLKVASNQVFFTLTATTTDATTQQAAKTTVNSQIKTVPVGIIMSVQPAVDPVTRRISLSLRPSITRITSFVNDPGVALTIAQFNQVNPNFAQNVSSPVPIIETREMDSVVNLESGDTLVMGGLMQDTSNNVREGIPGAMDIPVLGQAISSNIKDSTVSELVIFIRATLVNSRKTIADEDIRLYKTFTPDPRPIAF